MHMWEQEEARLLCDGPCCTHITCLGPECGYHVLFAKPYFYLTSSSTSPLTLTAKHSVLRALKYHRWYQLPCDCHDPPAVCFALLAIIDVPAVLHHNIKTGPILQISSHAHWWRLIYGLSGWTLCKLQGWVYRLNVQQEYPAQAEQFPCRGD